jgi:hypothetical protein
LAKLGLELLLPKKTCSKKISSKNTPLTKPVKPVLQTGHSGFSQKTPKEQQGQKPSKRTPNATKLGPGDFLDKEQHAYQKSS